MPEWFLDPPQSRHVVAIIGGAVAGSEAATIVAARGAVAIVMEQSERPFGKIEDGLPRWHEKLRRKEYAQITANLARPGILYVPKTALGGEVTLETLRSRWGVSAVLLASGAWRDRPLFSDADRFVGHGLVYQNPFVHWYNHYPEPSYDGPQFDVPDGAIVVGGGLASIDVVKIINLELYKRALAARGIHMTTIALEHEGIGPALRRLSLTPEQLGVRGCTLYYRREKTAMPLAQAPDNATAEQLLKVGQVRAKVMDKVIEKYLVRFEANRVIQAPIVEGDRLAGLVLARTQTIDGKLQVVDGDTISARSEMIISSIGSVPHAIPGLPMRGELIDFEDWQTGRVRGFDNVFGLGNALTGKGNIKESRKNSIEVSTRMSEAYLGLSEQPLDLTGAHRAARAQAEQTVEAAIARPRLSAEHVAQIYDEVRAQWRRTGFDGDVTTWVERSLPACIEQA